MGVVLSSIPGSGPEFEDYVAGLFQAAGYFVEKNIRQREAMDVLELDAVATSYEGPVPAAVLAEAKGGRWGFPDLFKVAGWMRYLGIERSGFFVREGGLDAGRDLAAVNRAVSALGVSLVDLSGFTDPTARLGENGFRPIHDPLLLEVWRLSFKVERTLLERLRQERRSAATRQGPGAVLAYHDLLNDHLFFLNDAALRLRRLYDAYRRHPRLALALALEIAGSAASGTARPAAARRALAEALHRGAHPALQASFYVEHRARLSILKVTIDLLCLAGAAGHPTGPGVERALAGLPNTLREGCERLQRRPSHRRYALLWQVFLWGLGGFYLADHEAEEFGWLSAQTGIPAGEIGAGLRAFDDLFPLAHGSWIVPLPGTCIRLVKLVPPAFRGVGAVQRLWRSAGPGYGAVTACARTRRSLVDWHNALVRLLSGRAPW